MLITVSGPPGSGKSSAAAAMADRLDLEHISGGDIFRQLAAERELSLAEFGELAETDEQIDRNLDRRLKEIATERDDLILESRLSGWLAGGAADLRIWLDAPVEVRAERIAERENLEVQVAKRLTEDREASERRRYRMYYDIDIEDRRIYDLILNTARWAEPTGHELLIAAVTEYDPSHDEGAVPINELEVPAE